MRYPKVPHNLSCDVCDSLSVVLTLAPFFPNICIKQSLYYTSGAEVCQLVLPYPRKLRVLVSPVPASDSTTSHKTVWGVEPVYSD